MTGVNGVGDVIDGVVDEEDDVAIDVVDEK